MELLGNYTLGFDSFADLDKVFARFQTPHFREQSHRKRFETIQKTLLDLCQKAKEPCFLLAAIIQFLARVNAEKLLAEPCRFLHFEFWLNHYSQLSDEENLHLRSKIVGKKVPRDEYQLFFPIGQNKTFAGSHFVAAHLSPDVDTTIASFWGWVDAFGCRVANGLHQWSLPGQLADSHIRHLFQALFSESVFEKLVRQTPALTLTALDLVTKNEMLKITTKTHSSQIDHTQLKNALVLVDEEGHFVGDWRANDSEAVRQIVMAFNSLLSWLENQIQACLIAVLAKKSARHAELKNAIQTLFSLSLAASEPAKEFTKMQKAHQNDFLKRVIGLAKGLNSTFLDLLQTFHQAFIVDQLLDPNLFGSLETVFQTSTKTFQTMRLHTDSFAFLLQIKEKVLGQMPQYITLKSDVDEIRMKMNGLDHLTVVIPEENSAWFPVGVVSAKEVQREVLGTVSLRDFSNELETKMASYLQVISVIDHHKSDIKTQSASTIVVSDAQSANTLVAELVMNLNERFSLLGCAPEKIEKEPLPTSDYQALKRLTQLKLNARLAKKFWIDAKREYSEYLLFLHAILDDTDLLTKVSKRDLECVAKLLNRMKSIASGRDMEIINFEALAKDDEFCNSAARLILQNKDMYSLYKQLYEFKEREVATNLTHCIQGLPSTIFADTKVQNSCCRVGQTKIFSANYPLFKEHADALRSHWIEEAKKINEASPQIDLHLQMISTIASAPEVHKGQHGNWKHQDECWIWIAPTQAALERLISFLNSFQLTKVVESNAMEVEFLGPNQEAFDELFRQNFPKALRKTLAKGLPIAVLKYKAGLINSRKAAITPCLPRLIA